MNLYTRLMSLFIFFACLFITYVALSNAKNKKKQHIIITIYTVIIVILGYFYKPYYTADLYRIFETIKLYYEPLSLSQMLSTITISNFTRIYYYIFAHFHLYQLLPAANALIVYGIVFNIFKKCNTKYKINNHSFSIIFLFILSSGQFVEVVSGTRFMISSTILFYCVYSEYLNNKKIINHIFLYLIAALFHPAGLVLICIRFLFSFFQKEKNITKKFISIISIILVLIFIYFNANNQFSLAIAKAKAYISEDVYSYYWEYIIAVIDMLFMFSSLRTLKRIDYTSYMKNNNYIGLYKLFFVVTVVMFPVYSIFHRFRLFLCFMFIPILFMIYEKLDKDENNDYKKKYNGWMMLFLLITYALTFLRGNLCGINFFDNYFHY